MKRFNILYLLTFILAFCSIVYELILAQSLSAFLENTALRYSVTIGLYMFSMGFGALIAEGKFVKHPVLTLLRVEILLTVIGGLAVVLLHIVDLFQAPRFIFTAFAHTLIILIGILTGTEIPLLIEITNKERPHSENTLLAVNYSGALSGTIVFALVLYPFLGLVPGSFLAGSLNAFAGILLVTQKRKVPGEKKADYHYSLSLQGALLAGILVCLIYADKISSYLINQYMS